MSHEPKRPLGRALLFGGATICLYVLMFIYSDQLVDWAERTKQGERILFLVPVVIAFVVSYFHGGFTGYFWEILGLRAARPASPKKH